MTVGNSGLPETKLKWRTEDLEEHSMLDTKGAKVWVSVIRSTPDCLPEWVLTFSAGLSFARLESEDLESAQKEAIELVRERAFAILDATGGRE